MTNQKRIALVAHDAKKATLVGWANKHKGKLSEHLLWATGTTGMHIENSTGLEVKRVLSGPMGGDQQPGAMIAEGKIDIVVSFIDPLSALPHDVDVKALVRISTLYQTAIAINETTANFILSSERLNMEVGKSA